MEDTTDGQLSPSPCLEEQNQQTVREKEIGERVVMKRNVSLFNLTVMLVTVTGHISIFITPGNVIEMSGSVISTIIIWLTGSFLVYSLALCFTELGTVFQSAGGPYLYLSMVFGNMWGFLIGWAYFILISGPFAAFTSTTAAIYILKSMSFHECGQEEHYVILIAVLILLVLTFFQCFHLKLILLLSNFLVLCKLLAIAFIISSGIYVYSRKQDYTENFKNPQEDFHLNPGRLGMAIVYVIFSNGGWQAMSTLTEEVKNPSKTLPRSIHLTFGINAVILLSTYMAYLAVLEKNEIIATKAVATVFFDRVWPTFTPVISLMVALASIGTLNSVIMGHSRLLLAAARRGDMPSILAALHPTRLTPMPAIVTIVLYGMLMLFSGGTEAMMQFIGLCSLIMGLMVVVALLYLRYKKPELPRPYKVTLCYPVLHVVVNIGLILLILYQETLWTAIGICIFLLGFPVFLIGVTWKNKPKFIIQGTRRITAFLQKCFLLVPS